MNTVTNPRVVFSIEYTGGRQISNCYYESTYTVRSSGKLTEKRLQTIMYMDGAHICYGQEFYVTDAGQDADGMNVYHVVHRVDSGD